MLSLGLLVLDDLSDTVLTKLLHHVANIKHLGGGGLELSGWNTLLEQQVQLGEGSALGLWQLEPTPDGGEQSEATPEQTGLGLPVPGGRVQHVRHDDGDDDTGDVVEVSGQDNGLGSQLGRWNLGDQTVTDWADRQVVDEGENQKQGTDGPGGVLGGGEAETADNEQDDRLGDETAEVDVESAELLRQEPGRNSTDQTQGVLDDGEGEGVGGGQAGVLVEVGGVSHEGGTGDVLHQPGETGDSGSSQVGLLERVEVGDTGLESLFLADGHVDLVHHGVGHELLVGQVLVLRQQSHKRVLGLSQLADLDQPPWRLGGEEDTESDRKGPHPLQGERNLVGVLAGQGKHGLQNNRSNQLTNDPTGVDVGGQVQSQNGRTNLRGVGNGQGLEGTPWQTQQKLTSKQCLNVWSKEHNEDETSNQEQRTNQRLSVADSVGDDTGEEQAENLTDVGGHGQGGLPLGWDLVLALGWVVGTELLHKAWETVEGVKKTGIVTLHDNGGGQDHRPHGGLGEGLQTLAQGHVLVLVVVLLGVVGDVQEFGKVVLHLRLQGHVGVGVGLCRDQRGVFDVGHFRGDTFFELAKKKRSCN